jgi:polyisoprenoid-binding protein YceI
MCFPTTSSVTIEIDASSLATKDDELTAHLKSPDFFDVAKFPKARFTSTAVTAQDRTTYTVNGNLELHGVTKQIGFPATIRVAHEQIEAEAKFAINRTDVGVAYPGAPDDLIRDDVLLKLTIRAPRAGR